MRTQTRTKVAIQSTGSDDDDGNFGNENNDGIFNNKNNDGKHRRHSVSLPHSARQSERQVVLRIMIVMKFTVKNMMNELSGSEGWRMLPVCDGLGISYDAAVPKGPHYVANRHHNGEGSDHQGHRVPSAKPLL